MLRISACWFTTGIIQLYYLATDFSIPLSWETETVRKKDSLSTPGISTEEKEPRIQNGLSRALLNDGPADY